MSDQSAASAPIPHEEAYAAAQRRIVALAGTHGAEAHAILVHLDDYVAAHVGEQAREVIRDLGLALVAAGQARLWQTLWGTHLAGREPVGYDDRRPGDEWAFLFGADWPKKLPPL